MRSRPPCFQHQLRPQEREARTASREKRTFAFQGSSHSGVTPSRKKGRLVPVLSVVTSPSPSIALSVLRDSQRRGTVEAVKTTVRSTS